jgi:shikimate kinase
VTGVIAAARRNLVLIGMMGSGKTTIGRHVARRLGRPFVDTDHVVAVEAGCSIPELFAERGEDGFRAFESAVIERVAAVPNQIIAVGGGAVCVGRNVEALARTGDVILLDASVSQLAGRVSRGRARKGRPLLGDTDETLDRLQRLWDERAPLYEAAAGHRVDSGHRPPPVIADEIVEWMTRRKEGQES